MNQMKKSMTSVILATALAAPMMIPATATEASWKKFKQQMGNSKCWGLVAALDQSEKMKEGCKSS